MWMRPGRENKRANAPKRDVSFAPINGRRKRNAACPKGAQQATFELKKAAN